MGWMSRFNWGRIVTSRSRLEVTTSLKTLCLSQRLFLLQAVWVMCSIPCVNLVANIPKPSFEIRRSCVTENCRSYWGN